MKAMRRIAHMAVVGEGWGRDAGTQRALELGTGVTPFVEADGEGAIFLDISGLEPRLVVEGLIRRVGEMFHLEANAGVAGTRFVARVASSLATARGEKGSVCVIPPGEEREFLAPLSVDYLWPVPEETRERLKRLGLRRIGEVAGVSRGNLVRQLGEVGYEVWEYAKGIDRRTISLYKEARTVEKRLEFAGEVGEAAPLRWGAKATAEWVASRLEAEFAACSTLFLELELASGERLGVVRSLAAPMGTAEALVRAAWGLLEKARPQSPVRAMRLVAGGIGPSPPQQARLADGEMEGRKEAPLAERALPLVVRLLRQRYGEGAVADGGVFAPVRREKVMAPFVFGCDGDEQACQRVREGRAGAGRLAAALSVARPLAAGEGDYR